ncbi:zinc metalloproteinase nas-13-like [Phlebotomus argentipes]|uniref:zinc metalloproteinase nas-13-like n=1 Tax=Phlebotomus argentipes TaxID=94469 RepID=UPI002893334A|nr:zinc metalloproteinase nas-13-like [Phlebotomus argentipes]
MKWILVVLLSLLATVLAVPLLVSPDDEQPIEEMGEFFEGDMELTEAQRRSLFDGMLDSRTGLLATRYRWPGDTLAYEFNANVNQEQRDWIELGLRNISGHTCLKFVRRTNEADYVHVTTDSTGCSSYVGRVGGMQTLKLAPNVPGSGCFRFGTVVHEFIHALGFHHSQAAYTRDSYIIIKWENIQAGTENNFNMRDRTTTSMFDLDYDYGSVMHYSSTAFSINGQPTIVPIQSGVTIGQRLGMSELDIKRLNRMYNCPNGQ